MPGNEGYINVVAVFFFYFDQAISGNWSYNPEQYEGNQVPVSVMAKDLLTTYKMGWKTSYYQNTYDGKNDNDEPQHNIADRDMKMKTRSEFNTQQEYDEYCEACDIMAYLNHNIPPFSAYIRNEYLYNHTKEHDFTFADVHTVNCMEREINTILSVYYQTQTGQEDQSMLLFWKKMRHNIH